MQIRVFDVVGLDYADHFYTKCTHKTSVVESKSYICLSICTAEKRVYLELISQPHVYFAALRRLISRSDCPSKILSKNGFIFNGAARYLKKLFLFCRRKKGKISVLLRAYCYPSFLHIQYNPHVGGLWKAAIKSTKHILMKVPNSAPLNFEEITLFFFN